jgi:hypothetical protein
MKYNIIAVDLDGILCEDNYSYTPVPIYRAFKVILEFKRRGGKVILWTCRAGEDLREAVDFCKENFLKFDAINENDPEHLKEWFKNHPDSSISPKIYADMYIDDKGNTGINWDNIEKMLNNIR